MEANTANLNFSLEKSLIDAGVSQRFAIRDIMRVMTNNMIQLSFPKNAAEGKRAIDADLNKVFNALDNADVVAFFESEFGDGSVTASGKLKGKKRRSAARKKLPGVKFNWQGDLSRMKAWHESHRKQGKVRTKSTEVGRAGNFKFYSGMYVPKTAMNRYKRMVYNSIAKFKAGWIPAADWLVGLTGGRSAVPAFARKQDDKRGSFGEWTDGSGLGGVYAVNKVSYASRLGAFVIERARLKTVAYSLKATAKQAEDIARRFNERKVTA